MKSQEGPPQCLNCVNILDFKVIHKNSIDWYCSHCHFVLRGWTHGPVCSIIEATKHDSNILFGEWASKEVDLLIRFTCSTAAYIHLIHLGRKKRIRAFKGRKIWTLWDELNPTDISVDKSLENLILLQRNNIECARRR
jgi:hypothetical protein